ncbi:hypothetical protein [Intestinirhabdus alba]|jgi:hypothetical protein|uniref:Uncharacterized protein n=1 Tax=Intestinirhabdus alba TaxID=2899544 RepID=A0A6L6IQX2_9ENTR|nr:hypothetical protein [Intestinirhabdus alba]MTH48635.1 hypothetical protein [Intestinirhabdus alba]
MNTKSTIAGLLLFFILPDSACSEEAGSDTFWLYDKTSTLNISGAQTPDNLAGKYVGVTIKTQGNKLIINDLNLKNGEICATEFVRLKQTPILYFHSQKTVDIYKALFKRENILFPDYINILTARFPEHTCPGPFSEIIETGTHLAINDEYYEVFFKKLSAAEYEIAEERLKENPARYCRVENPSLEFDGHEREVCSFTSSRLKEAYQKIKSFSPLVGRILKDNVPEKNLSYAIDEKTVSYRWKGDKKLQLSISSENQSLQYLFSEGATGTEVIITSDSQY